MPFSKEEIEYYHNVGLMPDWAYYQQNEASAQENYNRQKRESRNRFRSQQQERQQEREIERQIEDNVEEILENLLQNLNLNIVLK